MRFIDLQTLILKNVRYSIPNLTVMRILTTVLLLFSIPYFGLGQNTISGKVVDELGLPIYLAAISIANTDEATYSDYEGSFILTSNKDFHWKISISSKGYQTESFFVLSGGSTENIVLQYDEEMRKLINGTSSIFPRFFKNPLDRKPLFPKQKIELASTLFSDGDYKFIR